MSLLKKIKTFIEDEGSVKRYRKTCKAFTRNRSLSFSGLVYFLFSKGKSSLQFELDEYFSDQVKSYTKSAFSQHRSKLKSEVFEDLNQNILSEFYQCYDDIKTWKGFRLVGIDGSTMQLPTSKELIEDFGIFGTRTENNRQVVLARLSQSYDVLNGLILDAKIAHYRTSELSLADAHISSLKVNDLVIMDRAYASFWFMSKLMSHNHFFLIRLKEKRWNIAKNLLESGKTEEVLTIKPSSEAIKKCKNMGIPYEPLTVRIVKVSIENGADYVLITNLVDRTKYTFKELGEVYRLRWPTEESYKHLKLRAELENLSGKTTLAVKQDFYRVIARANLSHIISKATTTNQVKAINNKRRKDYQLNRCQAYRKSKKIIKLIKNTPYKKWLEELKKYKNELIKQLEIVRPKRKNPVTRRYGGRPVNFMAYKP